ncbi:hypothetical protein [Kitasatospora sp. NPDC059599]
MPVKYTRELLATTAATATSLDEMLAALYSAARNCARTAAPAPSGGDAR